MTHPAVAFVPFRVNSTRIPRKSLRILGSETLTFITVHKLLQLGLPVYVYCTDVGIARESIGDCEAIVLKRPDYLDRDDTIGIDIYREFEKQVPAEKYLLAHCTSPFVKVESYRRTLDALETADSAATVISHQTFAWSGAYPVNFTLPRLKTQDLDQIHIETSGAYAWRKGVLEKWGDRTSYHPARIEIDLIESVDIDTEDDWNVADTIRSGKLEAYLGTQGVRSGEAGLRDRERTQPDNGGLGRDSG